MKNKRQRMREFLALGVVVAILATITVFLVTSFAPLWAHYEEEPCICPEYSYDPGEWTWHHTDSFQINAIICWADITTKVYYKEENWTGCPPSVPLSWRKSEKDERTVAVHCGINVSAGVFSAYSERWKHEWERTTTLVINYRTMPTCAACCT